MALASTSRMAVLQPDRRNNFDVRTEDAKVTIAKCA